MPLDRSVPPSAWLATALLVGIACGPSIPFVDSSLAALPWLFAMLGFCRRRREPRTAAALFLLAAFGLGFVRAAQDEAFAIARTDWFPRPGFSTELHLAGVVLGSAEADAVGERRIRLRVRPERRDPGDRAVTASLRVGPSSLESTRRLDSLSTGDRVRVWARIRTPRAPGNPGEHCLAARLRAYGLDVTGSVKNAALFERVSDGGPSLGRSADRIRRWARDRLDRSLGRESASRGLIGAMLLGDRAMLSVERQRSLRRAGLAHLVAISGLHVGFVLWAVHAALGRAFRLRGWGRWLFSVALLSGFATIVGGRASVWRAVLGAATWLGGRCLGRQGTAWSNLLLVAAVLAWLRPWSVHGPGFQLTFLASAGILCLARPIRDALPFDPALGLGPAVTVSAYAATAPVVAWHFGWLAPVGLLTNLLALPVCACVLAAGASVLLAGDVPGVGFIAQRGCEWTCALLWWIVDQACALDGGSFAVVPPGATAIVLYYGLLAPLVSLEMTPGLRRTLVALLGLVSVWVHLGGPPARPSGSLEVRVIDVGQGLAVALRGPTGRVVLIDSGGSARPGFDPGERIVVPSLLRWSGRRVEALVLSHGDVDHAGGAAAVLEGLEVGELQLAPRSRASPLLRRVRETARARGTPVAILERGDSPNAAGIPLRVLGPPRSWNGPGTNDGSVVLLAGRAPARILLTGDLEARGEAELLASGQSLRAEALVVAHHGSRSATRASFLDRVKPRWALVSAGFENRFGHPHPEVRRRIAEAGARLARTDLDGALSLRATKRGWVVELFRGRGAGSPAGSTTAME